MRSSLTWLTAVLASAPLATVHAAHIERQVPADPKGEVVISDPNGNIEILGWDKALVSVSAEQDENAKQVEVTSEPGRTLVRVGHTNEPRNGGAQLTVHVPQASEVNVSTISSEVRSKGIQGKQHLHTVSGKVIAEGAGGDVELGTVSGEIQLHGTGRPAHLRLSAVNGRIEVQRAAGDLEATTVNGELKIELSPAHTVRLRTTNGELRFNGKLDRGATLEAETINGRIQVQASAEAGYTYEISSFGGEIKNCFGEQSQRTSEYGPGSRLDGKRGNGEGRIRIKSLRGEVSLCDH